MTHFDVLVGKNLYEEITENNRLFIQKSRIESIEKMEITQKYCLLGSNDTMFPVFFTKKELKMLKEGKKVKGFFIEPSTY